MKFPRGDISNLEQKEESLLFGFLKSHSLAESGQLTGNVAWKLQGDVSLVPPNQRIAKCAAIQNNMALYDS